MANTKEMLRLMAHAADLLDACDPVANAMEIHRLGVSSDARAAHQRANREVAAIGTASAILRMVAAAMDDEPTLGVSLVEHTAAAAPTPDAS